jgi:hypothetical protein
MKSPQVKGVSCCEASFWTVINWKTNCPAQETRKKSPVTSPKEYARLNRGLDLGEGMARSYLLGHRGALLRGNAIEPGLALGRGHGADEAKTVLTTIGKIASAVATET